MGEGQYKALAQWAEKEGTSPTTLATSLLSALIRKEVQEGRIEIDSDAIEVFKDEDIEQMSEFVKLLLGLRPRNGLSFAEIADITKLPSRQVEELYQMVESWRKQQQRK